MKKSTSILDINHVAKAFYYSIYGLKTIFQDEVAFKQELLLTIFIVPLGIYLGATPVAKAILIGSWFLILIMESVNSAIEAIVDRISLERHPMSKKIKDISSAAVLLAIINAVMVWAIILT